MNELKKYPGYFVNKDGEVFSCHFKRWGILRSHKPRKLSPVVNSHGYRIVSVTDGSKRKLIKVARLVIETFGSDKPSKKHEIRHLNGNSIDDRFLNLQWGTAKENAMDREIHGKTIKGSLQKGSKLTETDIPIIRNLLKNKVSQRKIANEFGVSQRIINKINLKQMWCHVG